MTPTPAEAAFAYVGAFVDELVRTGVRHVCIAPGSRSAPLALMIARHPALRIWMHLDERVAGFFALGMARALATPVALLCTSGTAAANFLPAVVEARRGEVPLLVLTADRPPELRDVGAAQTIDQNGLYGVHAKWFVDVAVADATPEMLRYARTLACRAAAVAMAAPAGPVHLNFPFGEPLVPASSNSVAATVGADALAWAGRPGAEPWTVVADARPAVPASTIARLAARLGAARRPLLICGPQYDPGLAGPLAALAAATGAPLLADPLSQARWGTHDRTAVIDRYDAVLRHAPAAQTLAPDLVIRFGAVPTSKALLQYLQRHAAARQIVVTAAQWPDPMLVASEMVHADSALLCTRLLEEGVPQHGGERPRGEWLDKWVGVERAARTALSAHASDDEELFEGRVLAELAALVPSGGTLFVSSSMPVRDLDAFAPGDGRALRVLANRGANGIDGVVSTALGVAAARSECGGGPLVLAIGDIAFYHDMNGLLAAKLHALDATIVVINNDGGGIFSFLPQAAHPAHFEQLFGTPHGLDFSHAAGQYGAHYHRAESWRSLRDGIACGIRGSGLHIVELRTDRARNVALHRDAWGLVAAALAAMA